MVKMRDIVNADLNGDGVMKPDDDRFGLYVFPNTPLAMFLLPVNGLCLRMQTESSSL